MASIPNSSSSAKAGPSDGQIDSSPFPSVKRSIQQFEGRISRSFEPIVPRCTVAETMRMMDDLKNWHCGGDAETVKKNPASTVQKLVEKQRALLTDTAYSLCSTAPKLQSSPTELAEGVGQTDGVDSNALETETNVEPGGAESSANHDHPMASRSISTETLLQDEILIRHLEHDKIDEIEHEIIQEDDNFSDEWDAEPREEINVEELFASRSVSTETLLQDEILIRHPEHDEIDEIEHEIIQEDDNFSDEWDAEPREEDNVEEVEGRRFSPPSEIVHIARAALYVRISLKSLAEGLPTHLKAYGSSVGRDFLNSDKREESPLVHLSAIAARILPCHEDFCHECEKVVKTWNPHNPDFAGSLLHCLENFKPFITLLDFKTTLLSEIEKLRKKDHQLNTALKQFELMMGIPRGKAKHQIGDAKRVELSTLIDQTYHAFRAYKYFMIKYSVMFGDCEEKRKAEKTILELGDIIKKMKSELTLPTPEDVQMLNEKSNGQFGGLKTDLLIAHGPVRRVQKNEKLEHRYLALHTSGLWIFRTRKNLMFNTKDSFETTKSRYIELGNLMIFSYEDENTNQIIKISDKKNLKTYKFLLSNSFERCEWDAKFRYSLDAYRAIGEQKRRVQAP